ncbi:MAG: extracellular solute-binding protein [Streptosporangiaceae bacterium]|jgi:molybdate/tungstate transport system substrate-binding protein
MMISRKVAVVALLCIPLAAAGCSSSSSSSTASGGASSSTPAGSPSASASSSPTGSGPVNVLYAGSLVDLMQKQIGPAFQTATGYSVSGISAGSKDLATEIKGKVHQGDVFISASPKVNATLEGASNGSWVSWYGTFATSALVIGYNPKSKFATDIKTMPWYKAITEPGIRVGFTDPATDPKGVLAVQAMTDFAKSKNLPALKTLSTDKSDIFPEETLVGRLQAGQLDAGFFYTAEATAASIPTVPLTGEDLKATYTITILNKAPHEAGAEAFVNYLLGSGGQAALKQDGFVLVSPATVTGSGVPSSLQSVLPPS